MPRKALKPCRHPGCPELVRVSGMCVSHAPSRDRDQRRPNSGDRGYTAAWRKIRAQVLRDNPWCVVCHAQATVVDHIVSLRKGGTHDRENLQPMCHPCHNRKTNRIDGGGWKFAG